ncbi:Gustatory receptor [Operophtera brumata]|uniref:Gustatory receptor n=1 Tax=Operophtera brumata TaxID=104452 RepID=A0A0L7L047_OPEBR|nr:Gustatory receptor [Operophtera brumata]
MIPDYLFEEGLNNTYLQNDMKHVQTRKQLYERTQRDYQEQRDMLSSQDGDTCEVHDQFYRDHKLLLVLFRALAVMPITRSRPVHDQFYRDHKLLLVLFRALAVMPITRSRPGVYLNFTTSSNGTTSCF